MAVVSETKPVAAKIGGGTNGAAARPRPVGGKQKTSTGRFFQLPTRLSHGQMKELRRISSKYGEDDPLQIQTESIVMMVKDWDLKDDDGNICEISEAGVDAADQKEIGEVFEEIGRMVEAAFPNPPTSEQQGVSA